MVEEGGRAGAAHQVLGEGGGVDDADGVADRFGLGLGVLPPGAARKLRELWSKSAGASFGP
jgi:hypothetical protein